MRKLPLKSLFLTTQITCVAFTGLYVNAVFTPVLAQTTKTPPPGYGEPITRTVRSDYGQPHQLEMPEDFGKPKTPSERLRRNLPSPRTLAAAPHAVTPAQAAPAIPAFDETSVRSRVSAEGTHYFLPSRSRVKAQPVYEPPASVAQTTAPQIQPDSTLNVQEGKWITVPPTERSKAAAPPARTPAPALEPLPELAPTRAVPPTRTLIAEPAPRILPAPTPTLSPPIQAEFDADELIAPRQTITPLPPKDEALAIVDDTPTAMPIIVGDDDAALAREEFAAIIATPPKTEANLPTISLTEEGESTPITTDVVEITPTDTPITVEELPTLTDESREILASLKKKLDTDGVVKSGGPVTIKHENPNSGLIPPVDYRAHEEMGLTIEVRESDPNLIGYLEKAYESLLAGNYAIAAGYYVEVLHVEPDNEMALFGLATTYHKSGDLEGARSYYGKLLKKNPAHREGVNNFMALLSDEAPTEALVELERLQDANPNFSPIPAQMGMIYGKLKDYPKAVSKLTTAIKLSPDNVSYKYNLAIILDKMGEKSKAADIYFELMQLYRSGVDMPWDIEQIKNRAIFLSKST